MKKSNLIAIITFVIFTAGCKKDSGNTTLDGFSVDITFDGVLRKCPQFGGAASAEGTLLGTVFFPEIIYRLDVAVLMFIILPNQADSIST